MKLLILFILGVVIMTMSLIADASTLGTLTVYPAPFGEASTFTYQLERRSQYPVLAVECYQNGRMVYLTEKRLDRRLLSGTVQATIDAQRNQLRDGLMDYTVSTPCVAVVFTERKGNQIPVAITPWVWFEGHP
jgi:hypothetical protein